MGKSLWRDPPAVNPFGERPIVQLGLTAYNAGATMTNEKERCLVTGGAGMLGYEIVNRLLAEDKRVRVLDIQPIDDPRVELFVGDVRDRALVERACEGVDVVHHTAAAVWNPSLPRQVYEEVNVGGTEILLDSCRRKGVPRLVFTSSIDVVVDGRRPILDGDESLPYPKTPPRDPYSHTKILSERMVLAANGAQLATCALRPAGMYGPRDRYHLPNLIRVARHGLNVRLGDGSALFSHVYSENVAHAHLLAAAHLAPGTQVAGQAYFITDHKPDANLFAFLEPFLRELELPPPAFSIPYRPAYLLASLAELVAPKSPFNRFSVVQTCVHHTFVHHKASRDFGYTPVVSRAEAYRRTVDWLKAQPAGGPE